MSQGPSVGNQGMPRDEEGLGLWSTVSIGQGLWSTVSRGQGLWSTVNRGLGL